MRIILEPTEAPDSSDPETHCLRVAVEVAQDHLTLHQMFECLIIPALMGEGYGREMVDRYMGGGE